MKCFLITKLFDDHGKLIRRYRQRMIQEWKEHGVFEVTEHRLYQHASEIRGNDWFTDLELENIRMVKEEGSDVVNESIENVEESQTERDIVRASERNEQIGDDSD